MLVLTVEKARRNPYGSLNWEFINEQYFSYDDREKATKICNELNKIYKEVDDNGYFIRAHLTTFDLETVTQTAIKVHKVELIERPNPWAD